MENLFTDLQAALFDLDGTLIETHIDFPQMKRETLALAARYGVNAEAMAALDILGIVEAACERLAVAGQGEAGCRLRREAFALLEAIEVSHCANPVEIPGAAELLVRLRAQGVRVGIVTRNCRVVSERLLAAGNLVCDALVTRDDVPRAKPDPGHLFAALEALGVQLFRCSGVRKEPERLKTRTPEHPVIIVGDHWMDIQAGRAAGMRTVGLLRGRPAAFFAPAPPDFLVNELAQLLPLAGA